jgi:uncharacterized repeat protein (TIGR03803 family)
VKPSGRLVAGPGGYLYGTETAGIVPRRSAYRFLPSSGQLERIHTFTDAEALEPTALVLAPDGNLYGASGGLLPFAAIGGPSTVFRMTPSGDVTVLHQFQTATEGAEPRAPLVVGGDGNLSGVTSKGGAFDAGTIFRITLAGAFEVLYTFTGGDDGGQPVAALIQATDGSLYGTASSGGSGGGGVVFRIKSLATEPIMTIDIPGAGATVGKTFAIAGWTIDRKAFAGTGIDAVHVYAFPNPGSGAAPIFLGVAALGMARPDVGAIFGSQFTASGYGVVSPSLTPGPYLVAALGRSTVTGTFSAVATRMVTVVAPPSLPYMSMDVPASNATVTGQIFVGGWALDFAAPTGTVMRSTCGPCLPTAMPRYSSALPPTASAVRTSAPRSARASLYRDTRSPQRSRRAIRRLRGVPWRARSITCGWRRTSPCSRWTRSVASWGPTGPDR